MDSPSILRLLLPRFCVSETSTPLKDTHAPSQHEPICFLLNRPHHIHSSYPGSRLGRRRVSTSNFFNHQYHQHHQPSTRRRHIHTLHLQHTDLTSRQHGRRAQRLQLRRLNQQRRDRLRDRIRRRAKAHRNLWIQQRAPIHHDRIRDNRQPILRLPSSHRHRHDVTARDLVLGGANDRDE